MHEDPTRMMGQPEPDHHKPHGNMRLLVAGLVAVIVGLAIAIVVIAGNDNGDTTTVTPSSTEGTTSSTTTTGSTTETTSPTTTETTSTPTETTTTPTAPPEEENGSGGIGAP
jgi:cytoskeletal protein RodZ